ncbi:CRISPR-associated endoribonuclease Cas6 [Leptolyngbya sp. NK1-12]|uniref:CRISPR-associated endoribonuclease Cas6 n=1 Tax=Leptolyngbya sp. NK1-12 TaxID=2547451 RepID=A0AA96WMZ5_9CYAN|nr:CRISPR-associated endoribonuclease Cas6 [Leptolyngbya sp. NK1-12]WNZ27815.1 CRISPR-associated endoribonuclease Cas6 [Leptolyngbya sp. NK1-12]
MPYSLVLNLLPRSPIPQAHLSGRHLHALFLDLVRSVDPELAAILHQQESEKAFTLSPLQVASSRRDNQKTQLLQWQHDRSIPAGTSCWWRVSLLDDALFSKLMHLWLNLNPSQAWHLGAADLQVVSVLGTPQVSQPWANFVTYTQLWEQASDEKRQLHFRFCTPTTFRQTKYDCALPTKDFVFLSLLRKWNHYSGNPFSEAILEPIYPSYFDIRTEIAIDSRSKLIGCVGDITFQILGDIEPIQIQQINALADFALYAGVGRKTPMGMGMAQRVN